MTALQIIGGYLLAGGLVCCLNLLVGGERESVLWKPLPIVRAVVYWPMVALGLFARGVIWLLEERP